MNGVLPWNQSSVLQKGNAQGDFALQRKCGLGWPLRQGPRESSPGSASTAYWTLIAIAMLHV